MVRWWTDRWTAQNQYVSKEAKHGGAAADDDNDDGQTDRQMDGF